MDRNQLSESLGAILRGARLTNKELAEASGIKYAVLRQALSPSQLHNFSVATLTGYAPRLADALDTKAVELVALAEELRELTRLYAS